jgi:hypothetical protein
MMTPLRYVRLSIVSGLLAWLVCVMPVALAHDEPVKTEKEKAEREQARRRTERLAVKALHAWLIPSPAAGRPADSILSVTIIYDSTGNPVEERQYDSAGTATTVELYDANGLWLEELSYSGDSLDGRSLFIYNDQGLISQVQDIDNTGTLTGRLQYRTVEKDNLIVAEKRTATDSLMYRIEYSYEPGSQFARLSGAVQYNADGTVRMRTRSVHEGDRRIQKFVLDPNGELSLSFEYQYTADGDFHEIIRRDPKGAVMLRQSFEYDSSGLLVSCVDFNADGAPKRTIHYHYEFFDRPHR